MTYPTRLNHQTNFQMLSISKMSSGAAANYFQNGKDELYYSKNEEVGIWRGELCNELGLIAGSEVDENHFKRMLNQIHPFDDHLLVERTQEIAGFDLTFSAPKSVSIQIETNPDESIRSELQDAHDAAVERVRQLIEHDYAGYQTREKDGARGHCHTGKIITAAFNHDTSRNLDPDTHTHLFVHNMTKDDKDQWRSLDARELFSNEYYLGMVYRAQIAALLEAKGYDLTVTDRKQGFFELAAVPGEMIDEFSTRSKEVENERERLKAELGRELTKEEYESAKTSTRQTKKKFNREELRTHNINRASSFEISSLKIVDPLHKQLISGANEALLMAAESLHEKESLFKKEELFRAALKIGLGSSITLDVLETELQINQELIILASGLVTTKKMADIESEILREIKSKQNSQNAILSIEGATAWVDAASNDRKDQSGFGLTDGQKAAAVEILASCDSVTLINGDAGTGKTTLLSEVNRCVMSENRQIFGLANTGAAAAKIESESGIRSTTLHAFLNREDPVPEDSILVVDEASMIGSKQLHQLIKRAHESNSKIVLLGDTKQFKGVAGGDMFSRLQEQPDICKTVSISESIRAKTENMKELYRLIKDRKFETAIGKMSERGELLEADKDTAIRRIVEGYDQDTLVIASRNEDRMALNYAIRDHLGIGEGGIEIDITQNITPNGVDRYFSQSYEVGSLITINKAFPGFKPGSRGEIVAIDRIKNQIEVRTSSGIKSITLFKYSDHLSVEKTTKRNFAVGDKISFLKNDSKTLNVMNGQTAKIQSIDGSKIHVQHEDGRHLEIDMNQWNHIDYGYALTDVKSQGQTAKKVSILADAKMANSNAFYVQVTRAQHVVSVYTDDIKMFTTNVERLQSKTSTVDYISTIGEKHGKQPGKFTEVLRAIVRDWASNIKQYIRDYRVTDQRGTEFVRDSIQYRSEVEKYRDNLVNRESRSYLESILAKARTEPSKHIER